jgi:P27 family predicted phage terminase small subunit
MPMPRKSLSEHALTGTKPQWVTGDEPDFVGGRPKMPKDLTPEAQEEWKRIVNGLSKRRTVTRVDSSMLELYVRMWARYKKVAALAEANPCTEVSWVDKNGDEHFKTVEHPASKMATQLENSLRNMLKELSATPASRSRTKPTVQPLAKNAPPHPDSLEGIRQEADRLQKLADAERAALGIPEPTPAPVEPEIDINSADLEKVMAEL